MKGLLKGPLVVAAVVVIGRVLAERLGAPASFNNLLSIAVLCVVIGPLYFALRIAGAGMAHPYSSFLKATTLFATLARAMVIPTYWLAYIYQWPDARFAVDNAGVVGPGVTPLRAFVVTPLLLTASWVIGSVIIGGVLGSVVIALKRRRSQRA